MIKLRWILALLGLGLGGFISGASPTALQPQPSPVKWSLSTPKKPVKSGQKFIASLTAHIAPGWHLYALEEIPNGPRPTQITIEAGQLFELAGEIEAPMSRAKFDENFGVETQFYETIVIFRLPLKFVAQGKPGHKRLRVQTRYQVCNEELCLPLKTVRVQATIKIK